MPDSPKVIKDAATFLAENGLLFEINRRILHPLGLELMVGQPEGAAGLEITGIGDRREEAGGLMYDAAALDDGARRFLSYMENKGGKAMHAERIATTQFVEQPLSRAARDACMEMFKEIAVEAHNISMKKITIAPASALRRIK